MNVAYRLYSFAQTASALAGVVGAIALFSGVAEAVAPGLPVPGGRGVAAAGVLALGVVGWLAFGRLRIGKWTATGRAVGLSRAPSSGLRSRLRTTTGGTLSIDPLPDLTGTVGGRSVRAKTYVVTKSTGSAGGGSTSRSYTVVETPLGEPFDDALLIGAGGDGSAPDVGEMVPGALQTEVVDDEFDAMGVDAAARASPLLTARARESMRAMEGDEGVMVGDVTDILMEGFGGLDGAVAALAGGALESKLREHPANDPSTVSINNEGLLLDPGDLERQAEAVVALADAVERTGESR